MLQRAICLVTWNAIALQEKSPHVTAPLRKHHFQLSFGNLMGEGNKRIIIESFVSTDDFLIPFPTKRLSIDE